MIVISPKCAGRLAVYGFQASKCEAPVFEMREDVRTLHTCSQRPEELSEAILSEIRGTGFLLPPEHLHPAVVRPIFRTGFAKV